MLKLKDFTLYHLEYMIYVSNNIEVNDFKTLL